MDGIESADQFGGDSWSCSFLECCERLLEGHGGPEDSNQEGQKTDHDDRCLFEDSTGKAIAICVALETHVNQRHF